MIGLHRFRFKGKMALVLAAGGLLLAACSGLDVKDEYPTTADRQAQKDIYAKESSIFGPEGWNPFSSNKTLDDGSGGGGIGVNSFLWRASLDTVAFMPLHNADPFGGVIITEWYAPPQTPNERFKVTVYILSRQLRSDAVRVAVFKQFRSGGVDWVDSSVDGKTAADLENAILSRARELRVAAVGDE